MPIRSVDLFLGRLVLFLLSVVSCKLAICFHFSLWHLNQYLWEYPCDSSRFINVIRTLASYAVVEGDSKAWAALFKEYFVDRSHEGDDLLLFVPVGECAFCQIRLNMYWLTRSQLRQPRVMLMCLGSTRRRGPSRRLEALNTSGATQRCSISRCSTSRTDSSSLCARGCRG